MQIDFMDTTITKQQALDIYKTLLEQENSNHTIFISVLLGITIIILGATWWWNKTGANIFIKTTVKDELDNKNEEIKLSIDTKIKESIEDQFRDMDEKFKSLELDLYRSFAYSLDTEKVYSHSIVYWSNSIEKAIELDEGELLRAFAETIANNLKLIEKKEVHQLEKVKTIVEKLPPTLSTEKREILTMLAGCKNV